MTENCLEYDNTETFTQSGFNCIKCDNNYYLDNKNQCIRRVNMFTQCEEYNITADKCKVWKKGHFLTSDQLGC